MPLRVAVLMDPIGSISTHKDSTFAMLLEASRRGHEILYFEQGDLFLLDGRPCAHMRRLAVRDSREDWFTLSEAESTPLAAVDVILARKDPPVDQQFLYDTMLLDLAARDGVLVVNHPQSLRDANEKLFTAWFPQCCPESLVSRSAAQLREFIARHQDCVLKLLDGMGGRSIFRARSGDPNLNVILETLLEGGRQVIAQRFIPDIRDGDKRILLIDGEPVPYALARIPQGDEFRGNLARGGRGVGQPLSERDRWICAQVGPELRRRGMIFVGLDVIGDYLTEINVTSPTCIRELDAQFGLNIAGQLFDAIEAKRA